jgi:hypothetical protein
MTAGAIAHSSALARELDIVDLNYVTSSEALGVLKYKPPSKWKHGVLANGTSFLAKWVHASLVAVRAPSWLALGDARVLAAVWSLNQQRAIEPVISGLVGSRLFSLHRKIRGPLFPNAMAYRMSIPFLGHVLKLRRRATGYRRIGFDHAFDKYWLTYGYYRASLIVLRRLRPKLILLSNDHVMETRTLAHAAAQLGIATAYIQHASVTKAFPPLAFKLAFLDGRDAAEKYDQPTQGRPRVFLTGIPRADSARKHVRTRVALRRLGICVNVLDPIDAVSAFVTDLQLAAPHLTIVLRSHPADNRPWGSIFPGLERSDATSEPPFDFLDNVDAIVTGPSNIALEAALVGVRPVFVDFGGLHRDHYGFVERGLCQRVETAEQTLQAFTAKLSSESDSVPLRAYCATIGTTYDGRSSELVQELITEYLSNEIDMSRWRPVSGFAHIDVFELRE